MTKLHTTLVALLVLSLARAPVLGQTVFFDDFDGNALLPHWGTPPASHWEYNVSNSMLNVTGLFYPSSSKSPGNFASIGASFEVQSDFRVDAWMGWESGFQPHRLSLLVGGRFGGSPNVASFGYRNQAGDPTPVIFAGASNQAFFMPAPDPGIHHFTITRTGTKFHFYLNGNRLASFADGFATPAAAVGFEFVGPYPGTMGAFHIDRVVVVPTSGGLMAFLTLPLVWTRSCRS